MHKRLNNIMSNASLRLKMGILSFVTIISVNIGSAYADDIPFFSTYPKIDRHLWYISNGWANGDWQSCEWQASAITASETPANASGSGGGRLKFTVSDKGGSVRPIGCGDMHTNKVTGYGTYEARLRTAAGSGLNTAFFTYVGNPAMGEMVHDEIDFEFLGKDPKTVQLNYFTNGKSMGGKIIHLGFDASKAFHNYTFIWQPRIIMWYVDGKIVYWTKKGEKLPSHPQRTFIDLWSSSRELDGWMGSFKYKTPVSADFEWVKFTPQH